jgi:hypothetical protein
MLKLCFQPVIQTNTHFGIRARTQHINGSVSFAPQTDQRTGRGPWGARSPTSDGVGCSSLRWRPSPSSSPSFSSTPPSHRLIEGLTQSHRPLRHPLLAATLPWRLSFELHRHRGLRLHALCTPPTQAEGLAHCSSTPSRSTWQHGKAPIGGGLER